MRLSVENRLRLVNIYHKNNLMLTKNKYDRLSYLAAKEQIFITARRSRDIIAKWEQTGSITDIVNNDRGQLKTKVTERQLYRIEREVFKRRDITSPRLKAKHGLQVSARRGLMSRL